MRWYRLAAAQALAVAQNNSGAGRWCDEERVVGSAAFGCKRVPSGTGKMEILARVDRSDDARCGLEK